MLRRNQDVAYLRERILSEDVMAARAATPEAGAIHAELALRYRAELRALRLSRVPF
jgi:hypothetical protein